MLLPIARDLVVGLVRESLLSHLWVKMLVRNPYRDDVADQIVVWCLSSSALVLALEVKINPNAVLRRTQSCSAH